MPDVGTVLIGKFVLMQLSAGSHHRIREFRVTTKVIFEDSYLLSSLFRAKYVHFIC